MLYIWSHPFFLRLPLVSRKKFVDVQFSCLLFSDLRALYLFCVPLTGYFEPALFGKIPFGQLFLRYPMHAWCVPGLRGGLPAGDSEQEHRVMEHRESGFTTSGGEQQGLWTLWPSWI